MKTLRTDYTFNASAKTVTFSNPVDVEGLLLITNVTDNIIIYSFADATKGGTVVGLILTLTYNTTPMSDSDKLQIFYDDGAEALTDSALRASAVPVSGTFTATDAGYTRRVDSDVSGNPIYIGKAAIGSDSGAAAWQIQKITYDGNGNPVAIQWAGSADAFTNSWDNRASLLYS